ncbi:hypothetical protein OJ997_03940 [Solirubrobacter phytolaccae]|uniref:Fibronectin type-III domain-containing protein n=1 Tax=Solirubrobacter phytolaccae TaxID=1404360 RepID=A0A9X3S9N4_9ACTN|nr:family 16 glycoside hydrolase [Solirubrobacter phytolaccae]MDA0179435.1 hypothetical protein [Solirubrobacter phytolaccae]
MQIRSLAGVALAALALVAAAPASAQERVLVDESFSASTLPSGWTSVLGDWKVVDGRLQASTDGARARIAFGPAAPTDFKLEATVRFVTVTNAARWLNVGIDYHAAADYGAVLVARSGTTASNGLELAQAAQGGSYASSPVGPAPTAIGTGQDHRLAIEVHGTQLVVSLDGATAMTATNLRRTGGSFGFVINNSTVQFDDVKVTELAAQPTAPSVPQQLKLSEVADAATVTWQAPQQGGPISHYEVAVGDGAWQREDALSHTFTGLSDGEQVLKVRAVNTAGVAGPVASVRTMRGAPTVNGFKLQVSGGSWPSGHVQGIAVDPAKGFIYYSFTNLLVKTDLAGNVVGTMGGFTGHLGDLDFNPADGRVYGSLEYKAAKAFYIAIFDVDKIDRVGMSAQGSPLVSAVYLPEVVEDYTADLDGNGVFDGDTASTPDHRYGSSGIDGVAFGPRFGSSAGTSYLTVAYGIYANTSRTDNDHQVLLQYDPSGWRAFEHPLVESAPHRDGPAEPDGKFFVFTGNTRYGVQNLEYDPWLERWFLGVYTGSKPQFPNYGLFAVDAAAQPKLTTLQGLGSEQGLLVPLAADGLEHTATGIRGWRQKADVGIQSLGQGLFYLATDGNDGGNETATLRLERWTGDPADPFAPVTAGETRVTAPATVRGTVPSTLSLTLGGPATFAPFTPGVEQDYTASTLATVTSSAGDATLSVTNPGHLANGAFTLASPLAVELSKATWSAPVSNDRVTVTFKQHIGANDPLRAGAYERTVTLTLATTTP